LWYYREAPAIEKIGLEKFEKNLKNRNITIYIFYGSFKESRRDDYDIYKIAIYLITMKFLLSPEYENYGDIFFPVKYIKIAENPQIAYTINLKENIITFYRLIYYLSEKELRILREYLKKNQ
jgi:hypothetical protein